jgi:DNA-directed RNA polymerase sigma subunit (sigma70/sigma32)
VELGLTKERVRQIEKQALAKLRHPSNSRELIGYLG